MITFNDLFEKLRLQAESDTADRGTDKRRPSWGPALVLGDDFLMALTDLNHEIPDKKVARLWAIFANPNKVGRYLRVNVSTLPMEGVRVRAFELRLGTDQSGEQLLQAKRGGDGAWSVDATPRVWFPRYHELSRAEHELKRAQHRVKNLTDMLTYAAAELRDSAREKLPDAEATLAEYTKMVAELGAENAAFRARKLALEELIKQRVAEFAGNPLAQMIAGAHVTGNCAICGRGLTDPVSLERGIGPECYGHIAPALRAHVEKQERAA
jgi:Family of unknown function (DUF6011)